MHPFNNDLYLQEQTKHIMERVGASGQRLYLEFGGKLIGDFHAARVLPGFDPNVKMRLLQNLSANADIIICIHAGDIERKKIRADLGITYDNDALRLIDDLRNRNVNIAGVVITRFNNQPSALEFKKRLEKYGIGVFLHREIAGYPENFDYIVSDLGFGSNPYIPVKQPLVVVTGPGPNSGKMGTCLSQIYHEYGHGNQAHYAKFETFPVWNLPLNHPVNIAYEAATADLQDANALDHFHYDAHNVVAVNYNRDLQAFPLLKSLLSRITGKECPYQSPTDMGVNCIAAGIVDDTAVSEAAKLEIERRYFRIKADYMLGRGEENTFNRIVEIIGKSKVDPEQRDVVVAAREAAKLAAELTTVLRKLRSLSIHLTEHLRTLTENHISFRVKLDRFQFPICRCILPVGNVRFIKRNKIFRQFQTAHIDLFRHLHSVHPAPELHSAGQSVLRTVQHACAAGLRRCFLRLCSTFCFYCLDVFRENSGRTAQ